jgi:alanyl-tRNA synthetase
LVLQAKKAGPAVLVRRTYTGRTLDSIKAMARIIAARPGAVAILAVADAGQLVVARSGDLQASCHEAVRRVTAEFGGKGGGKPELAQAGGFPPGSLEPVLTALEAYFSQTVI